MVETMLPESQNKRKQKIESTPPPFVSLFIRFLLGWQRVTPSVLFLSVQSVCNPLRSFF